MAPSKIRKAIGAVKDQTSISLAKVGSSPSLSDLDVAIVKATRHEEYAAEEKHIREILSLTSYSRAYVGASVRTIARRLNKTRNWTVAVKTLMLIHRLLSDGDPAYEQEFFFATRRGTRLLILSDFHDSRSGVWDYSAFVRTYALYLDERLEYRMQNRRGRRSGFGLDNEEHPQEEKETSSTAICIRSSPVGEMENEDIFSKIQHLQQLLDRFLACRPAGLAKNHRVVQVALHQTVKESFQIYYEITEILSVFINRFMELEMNDSIKVYEIFRRVAKQFEELDGFYEWCKIAGVLRPSEFPEVEKITHKKLDLMDEYIRDKSSYREENGGEERSVEEPEVEEDTNATKALPAPELEAEPEQEPEPTVEVAKEEALVVVDPKPKQTEGDLLNLGEDAPTTEQHANSLAFCLFNGGAAAGPSPPLAWEAFKDTKDWETALVQSASNLSHQRAEPGGGFDMLLLEGMYQQGANVAAMNGPGYGTTGSASSVALGSAGRPATLALPAPPSSDGHPATGSDPFAASLSVAPPAYVQMSDMEKKQKMLMEEQMMWAQYKRDGMQGHLHQNTYRSGGYGY